MKKKFTGIWTIAFVAIIVTIIIAYIFTGCSNLDFSLDNPFGNQGIIGWGNYAYSGVHYCGGGTVRDIPLISWRDNEGNGIEVKTSDSNVLWMSEGTYVLYKDYCPICNGR